MSNKKRTPARRKRASGTHSRVLAIVTDLKGYSADTREAIARAYAERDDDLGSLVTLAEEGGEVWDARGELPEPSERERLDDLARRIAGVLNDPLTPAQISEGIVDGLTDLFNGAALDGTQSSFTHSYEYVAALLKYFGGKASAK